MVGPGGQEVDQFVEEIHSREEVDPFVEEIHSRGYTVVESLGPDLGRCFDSDEIFEEMGDGSEDENSGVNGRRMRTCHYVFGGN